MSLIVSIHPFLLDRMLTKRIAGGLVEVQVNSAMKISELIRRIRADTNIAPGMSANPVIVINKEQAGHMTTLGEHGVYSGKKPSVVFSYDAPSSAAKKSF